MVSEIVTFTLLGVAADLTLWVIGFTYGTLKRAANSISID